MEILLLAKVLAFTILITRFWQTMPEPFVPFVPGFDQLPESFLRYGLMAMLVVAPLALLLNCSVRLASFATGVTMLTAIVSSRLHYGNNHLLVGLVLVLIGLYTERLGKRPLQLQLAIVYFGAGLNKLLEADWRSGHFFEYWAVAVQRDPITMAILPYLPELTLGKLVCWGTIVTELGLAVGLLLPRTRVLAIWVSILFHTGLLLFTGKTFGLFFYVMLASMLVFVDWPETRPIVIFDGDCGLCNATRRLAELFDGDGFLDWKPLQSGVGERFGLSRTTLMEQVHLVAGERIWAGFRAVRVALLLLPVTYFAMVLVVAGLEAYWDVRRVVVLVTLLFFTPLFTPAGNFLYQAVARNRHWLWPGSQCEVAPKQ